ncbi:uncharacterized protein LOC134035148 [Osmerus eperlanus]|uniref:uncharacterized protein LOC134035148 n=1 Tax=Osmerus eperlanus TaxID=29151 RepID=UPI002E0FCFCB
MSREACPRGKKWDRLLVTCVPSPTPQDDLWMTTGRPLPRPQPATGSPVVRWATDASATMGDPAFSLAVWVSVGVVVNCSVLALCLWFIIYRLRATHTNSADDPEAGLEVPDKTHPSMDRPRYHGSVVVLQRERGSPQSWPQMNGGGDHTAFSQEEGLPCCRDSPGCGGGQGEWGQGEGGLVMCRSVREHVIPLPAIELGDAALVTTKTVQCSN